MTAVNRTTTLMELLTTVKPELATRLLGYHCIQITRPRSDDSIKRHITDIAAAAESNRPFKIDIAREHITKNCYNCYIDIANSRLCFIIWNGAITETIEHV